MAVETLDDGALLDLAERALAALSTRPLDAAVEDAALACRDEALDRPGNGAEQRGDLVDARQLLLGYGEVGGLQPGLSRHFGVEEAVTVDRSEIQAAVKPASSADAAKRTRSTGP
ncbi:MAG: hypothetical protein ACRDZ4_13045 [Egibacteraceae bacterium]